MPVVHADDASDCKSTEWLNDENCQQILYMLQNPEDEKSKQFRTSNRKKLYKGGKLDLPFFCLGEVNHETVLCRVMYTRGRVESRRVVTNLQARTIIENMHRDLNNDVCKPGGINALVGQFTLSYYCKGIRSVVEKVLSDCSGTCKLNKPIETNPPPPQPIRTMNVMEEIQCDLIFITTSKGLPPSVKHKFNYILSVKDCFSKYCWLFPLQFKKALPIAQALISIFNQFGPPKYLHTDNGKEFVNETIQLICKHFSITIKKGRPYHPQSQGQVEVLNKRVKTTLSHFLQRYHQDVQRDIWPYILKEVSAHINNTWHHTIRNTPFNVLMGRQTKLQYNSDVNFLNVDGAYMAEDFLLSNQCVNPFIVEIGISGSSDSDLITSEIENLLSCDNQCDLNGIAKMENTRLLINKKAFEATESTIIKNRRAHLPKVKLPVFTVGDEVLFRNPNRTSTLSGTLNIQGVVTGKLSNNVYQVTSGSEPDERNFVVYSSEIVSMHKKHNNTKSMLVQSSITANNYNSMQTMDLVEKIREFADMCRNDAAKKAYGCKCKIEHTLQDIETEIGIKVDIKDVDNLMTLFYVSMDCFFLYTLSNEPDFKRKCSSYASIITNVLKENHFCVYLSGIYFWETVRCNTTEQILNALAFNYLPVFHKCSECIESSCKHICCKRWYIDTGLRVGILEVKDDRTIIVKQSDDCTFESFPQNKEKEVKSASPPEDNNTAKSVHNSGRLVQNFKKSYKIKRGKSVTKSTTTKKCLSNTQSVRLRYAKLSRLASLKKSRYSRLHCLSPRGSSATNTNLKSLKNALTQINNSLKSRSFSNDILKSVCLLAKETLHEKVYSNLSKEQKSNLRQNLDYIRDVLGKISKGSNFLTQCVPSKCESFYMQRQGSSTLCGLCAVNNLLGKEEFVSSDLDKIADVLWFNQICNGLSLTDEIQSTRSDDGYYCIEVLLTAASERGMTLENLSLLNLSVERFEQEFIGTNENPKKLMLGNKNEHYVSAHTYGDRVVVFDPLLSKPVMITSEQFLSYVNINTSMVFKLELASTPLVEDGVDCNKPWYMSTLGRNEVRSYKKNLLMCLPNF